MSARVSWAFAAVSVVLSCAMPTLAQSPYGPYQNAPGPYDDPSRAVMPPPAVLPPGALPGMLPGYPSGYPPGAQPGRRTVPGAGVWVQTAPPTPYEDARPGEPNPGHVWVPGYWVWTGSSHAWRAGHWQPDRPGHRYVPGRWHQGPQGWMYIEGYWSR